MNGLREEIDQALRTLPVSGPPVEQTRRDGRRLRTRRRWAGVAGALAVAAAVACYPALTGGVRSAPPAPAIGPAVTPSPAKSLANGDAVVTVGPAGTATMGPDGLTGKSGLVAEGTVAGASWQLSVNGPGPANAVAGDSCYRYNYNDGHTLTSGCADLSPGLFGQVQSGDPAAFTGMTDGRTNVTVGVAADDVTYFIVTFADGQRLKLLPVTVAGHRYVAWIAPANLVVGLVEAHLGGPYNDSGQVETAAPFDLPGVPLGFGLWQKEGESAPPRDTRVIGSGRAAGHAWKMTAHEGPWGTCVVATAAAFECVPVARLTPTGVLGIVRTDHMSAVGWGSAAPGVTRVKITLSGGQSVDVTPTGVGNENLFAFWAGQATSASWTAYDATGKEVGHGVSP